MTLELVQTQPDQLIAKMQFYMAVKGDKAYPALWFWLGNLDSPVAKFVGTGGWGINKIERRPAAWGRIMTLGAKDGRSAHRYKWPDGTATLNIENKRLLPLSLCSQKCTLYVVLEDLGPGLIGVSRLPSTVAQPTPVRTLAQISEDLAKIANELRQYEHD
jgi:hypothetical protein